MSNLFLIGLIVGLIFALVSYIATTNYIIAGLLFVISILYFSFRVKTILKKHKERVNNIHLAYQFINNFIISLSIHKNVETASKVTIENFDPNFMERVGDISELSFYERTQYLSKIFKMKAYCLFLTIVEIYQDNGGDILNMSSYLLNKVQSIEGYILSSENYNKKKLVEFIILWSFSIGIIVFLRFALRDFFPYLIKSNIYCWGIFLFFILILASIEVFSRKISNLNLGGEIYE